MPMATCEEQKAMSQWSSQPDTQIAASVSQIDHDHGGEQDFDHLTFSQRSADSFALRETCHDTSLQNGSLMDSSEVSFDSNLQEPFCRLQICDDIYQRAEETFPPMSPLGWILRFQNHDQDVSDEISLGGLNYDSDGESPAWRPQVRNCKARQWSWPLLIPANRPSTSPRSQSGAEHGSEDESAMYRRQVASALQGGRPVWL